MGYTRRPSRVHWDAPSLDESQVATRNAVRQRLAMVDRLALPVSGEMQIGLCWFVVAMAALCTLAEPCVAEPTTDCAKGPVSNIPESIKQSIDEQEGVTRYIDKSTSARLDEDAFYLYVIRKGCDVWLRVRAQYVSDRSLNIVRLLVKADGKTFELSEPHFQRDSDGKFTWQWMDDRVSVDHLLMLYTISASKSAIVHFVGASRTEERVIGDQEKAALKAMLNTYQALGGQL
jgi:hypothetical protein